MQTLGTRTQPLQAMPLQATFKDGLGTRYLWDGAGGPLEVLTLHPFLGAIKSSEALIHERVSRLAQFREGCYVHVRDVERDAETSRLAVVSDHVPGVRLSRMLTTAEQHLLPLDVSSALCLVRQLLSALATLHEATPDTWHGALASERIVVTPDGRVVIMEHVFGAALQQLEWSPERYWRELRLALPPDREQAFTRRGDVFQAGLVTLSLVLGRPLGQNEYPSAVGALATGTFGLGGGFDPLPKWLQSWLSRALWLEPAVAFKSATEARQAFEAGLAQSGMATSEDALQLFLTQYESSSANAIPDPTEVLESAPPVIASPVSPSPAPARLQVVPPPDPTPPVVEPPTAESENEEFEMAYSEIDADAAGASRKGRLIAAAVVLVALTTGGALAARRYLASPSAVTATTGRLVVQTNPAGAEVVIDGKSHGVAPLTLSLSAGPHTLELVSGTSRRSIPVSITARTEVSQFIDMPRASEADGQLDVRTDPPGARVSVDGQRRGVTPLTVSGLMPGKHVVVLENDLGQVSEDVTIESGRSASLVVPLRAPQGAPVSGWISIVVPVEVQVFESNRLLGSSRTDRIMVATGRHDLEFVNEALGYRSTQTIQVGPGQVVRAEPTWPQGTIAINAAPWANVWLDGRDLGETPVGATQLPIGTHEVVFRHPQLGEQRFTATVTATTPTRLSVDMRKK